MDMPAGRIVPVDCFRFPACKRETLNGNNRYYSSRWLTASYSLAEIN